MGGFDVVTIGSMNMDIVGRAFLTLRLADSNPGVITHTPGGVGRNIAHNLALLGKKTALISVVGEDLYGQSLLARAQEIGLDVSHCAIMKHKRSSTYLALLDEAGEMVSAINDMAIIEHLTPDFFAPLIPFLGTARTLVIDCNLPQATLEFLLNQPDLPPIFVDGVSSVKIVKIKHLLAKIALLKPNRLEAETLSGINIHHRHDMEKVSGWFHTQGLENLIISDAQNGIYYSQASGGSGWLPVFPAKIVNVSGAGDALVAGLVCGWLEGWNLPKAAHFAQGCAAVTLEHDMTNNPLLSLNHVLQRMENDDTI